MLLWQSGVLGVCVGVWVCVCVCVWWDGDLDELFPPPNPSSGEKEWAPFYLFPVT